MTNKKMRLPKDGARGPEGEGARGPDQDGLYRREFIDNNDVEGHSLAELNQMTGIKEGTLKSRLHRARVRLGKLLKSEQMGSATRPGARVGR